MPLGTGGTIAGLIEASHSQQQILGFSALKGDFLSRELQQLTEKRNWQITDQYCCGGYAKTTAELLQFIQDFEQQYDIPLEQIYTGKMLLGLKRFNSTRYIPHRSSYFSDSFRWVARSFSYALDSPEKAKKDGL